MPRTEATTVALRLPRRPDTDVWDELLRVASSDAEPVGYDDSGAFLRRTAHWLVPAVLTALMGVVGLAGPGLWTDELATWGMTRTPWHEFWPVLRYVDAVLAPYYVAMHRWVDVFGDSDIALRLPSLLSMVVSAGLIGVLGAQLVSRRAGLLAGMVFALLPSTSRFAAEVRPYAICVLLAIVATLFLLQAWRRPVWFWWVGYGCAIALLGLLHVVALVLVAAHAWLVAAWRRPLWQPFLVTAMAAVAPSLPLLVIGARQRNQVAYIPRVSFATAPEYLDVIFGSVGIAALIVGLALLSLPLRFPGAVFMAWAVVPVSALVVVSLALPMFLPRYLLFTTPGWALLAGVALTRLRSGWVLAFFVALVVLAVPVQLQLRTHGGHGQATHQLADIVAANQRPGDGVVYAENDPVGGWTTRDAIDHYLRPQVRPADVLMTQPPRTKGLLLATECSDVSACLAGVERLWVVRTGSLSDPLTGIGSKEDELRLQFTLIRVWYPKGLTLALLERRPPPN